MHCLATAVYCSDCFVATLLAKTGSFSVPVNDDLYRLFVSARQGSLLCSSLHCKAISRLESETGSSGKERRYRESHLFERRVVQIFVFSTLRSLAMSILIYGIIPGVLTNGVITIGVLTNAWIEPGARRSGSLPGRQRQLERRLSGSNNSKPRRRACSSALRTKPAGLCSRRSFRSGAIHL